MGAYTREYGIYGAVAMAYHCYGLPLSHMTNTMVMEMAVDGCWYYICREFRIGCKLTDSGGNLIKERMCNYYVGYEYTVYR